MKTRHPAAKARVVSVTGAKTALELAKAWAQAQERGVVVVQLDPGAGGEVPAALGLAPAPLASLVPQAADRFTAVPRNVVELSEWGVGVVQAGMARLRPSAARRALEALSRRYLLVLEPGDAAPLGRLARRMSQLTLRGGGTEAVAAALPALEGAA